MKRKLFIALAVIVLAGAGATYLSLKYDFFGQLKTKNQTTASSNKESNKTADIPQIQIPGSLNLDVPYVGQAPFANWEVHEESCEEAAVLMVHYYFEKVAVQNNTVAETTADKEMRAMKNWEVKNYGSEPDLNMTSLGEFAKEYYGHNFEVKKNITEDDIKQALSEGKVVVAPVMTHGLQNSMYGRETAYHVLLIKGYDGTGVFTNDAGVGNGKNHHYNWNILWQAIDQQTAIMN